MIDEALKVYLGSVSDGQDVVLDAMKYLSLIHICSCKDGSAYRENNNSGYDFACDRRNNQIMCKPLRQVKKAVTTLAFLMLVIFLLPIAASSADTGRCV